MDQRIRIAVGLSVIALGCLGVAFAQDESADGTALSDHNEGMWEIDVQYPHFMSAGEVASQANAELAAAADEEFSSFLAEAKVEVPKLRKVGSPGLYILKADPFVTMDLPELCSGYAERMVATGGANANQTYSVFNYAQDGEGVRRIALNDLFLDRADPVAGASKAVVAEIKTWDNQPSAVMDGTWTELTPQEAQRFVITEAGLLFLFDKYELGPGAEGTHKVLVSYDNLPGLDYSGVLKPLFESGMQD